MNQKNQKFKAAWHRFAPARLWLIGTNEPFHFSILLVGASTSQMLRPNRLALHDAKRPLGVLGKGIASFMLVCLLSRLTTSTSNYFLNLCGLQNFAVKKKLLLEIGLHVVLRCSFGLNQKNQKFKAAWPRFAPARLWLFSAK
ncbi:hypothetical protein [Pedobacter sp.]